MKAGEKIYRNLKKQGLSDKEIAEAFVLPHDLTKKEKAKADKELAKIGKKKLAEMTERDYLLSDKFKKKFQEQVKKDTWAKDFRWSIKMTKDE